MDIYQKDNNGMLTPQGEPANYWTWNDLRVVQSTGVVTAEVYWWEKQANALANVSPRCSRVITWQMGVGQDIASGVAYLLVLENYTTDDGIVINLKDSIIVS